MRSADMTRRGFLTTVGVGVMSLNWSRWASAQEQGAPPLPGVEPSETYPETSSRLSIKDASRFTILQLTDAHFHQRRQQMPEGDQRSIGEWKQMIDACGPDLLAITGDLWHDNFEGRGEGFMRASLSWIEELGVPWLFAWGNHDQMDDYRVGHDAIHDAKGSLYRGGPQGGNYTVEIVRGDGSIVWELICLNTHRHGLVGPSLDWLIALADSRRDAEPGTNAFAMFHIPIKAYADREGRETFAGITLEPVSHEKEDGSAFDRLKKLKSVRACFCGHDHVNDYSIAVDGIEMVYGRASGWCGYGFDKVRKGGKLITVNCETGRYAWETVFPEGLRWRPKQNERVNRVLDEPWMKDPLARPAA